MTTLILPAAGWGRRVEPLTQGSSKELLPHPVSGEPLIEKFLNFSDQQGWETLVIVREEKRDLRKHLADRAKVLVIQATRDWPETALQAEPFFSQNNFLCLPDTSFDLTVLLQAQKKLEQGLLVYGRHVVSDPENWGVITPTEILEKVPAQQRGPFWAWGFMGFQKSIGRLALRAHQLSNSQRQSALLPEMPAFVDLVDFKDLTRDISAIKVLL